MSRRSQYADLVGEWVRSRRTQLGLSQAQLAELVPVSVRTVGNVENGVSVVAPLNRPAWERALQWPEESLTAAYARGLKPGGGGDSGPGSDVLDEAGIPEKYRQHPDVDQVLSSTLSPADQVAVLKVWLSTHQAFEQSFHHLRDLRRAR